MTAPAGRPVLTGWHDGAALHPPGAAYPVSGDVTLTARWDSITNALAAAPGGAAATPVPLALALDLGTMPGGAWAALLAEIQAANKYVALDLSACALPGGLFDPYIATASGESLIAALTLPDAATRIQDGGTYADGALRHFTALEEVHGAHIGAVGDYAFSFCDNLTTADFPQATSIGEDAFFQCFALTTADFPLATSIGVEAFRACSALATVNLPAATSIGNQAFCYAGWQTGLTVTLGASPPTVGTGMFYMVMTAKTVTVKRPASGTTAYGDSPVDTTTENWGNAFRGRGWNGTSYLTGSVNNSINLSIEDL
jgi:hypothetical protein